MSYAKKTVAAVFAGAVLVAGASAPAHAAGPQNQDGLVNVAVGDVTILENVAVAAQIAATLCDIQVGPVAVLGQAVSVDRSGRTRTVCTTENGPVTISQN